MTDNNNYAECPVHGWRRIVHDGTWSTTLDCGAGGDAGGPMFHECIHPGVFADNVRTSQWCSECQMSIPNEVL